MGKIRTVLGMCAVLLCAGQVCAAEGETQHILSVSWIEAGFGTVHLDSRGDMGIFNYDITASYESILPNGFTWRVKGVFGPSVSFRGLVTQLGSDGKPESDQNVGPIFHPALEWAVGYTPVRSEKNTLSLSLSSQIDWYFGMEYGRYYYTNSEGHYVPAKLGSDSDTRHITTLSIGPDVTFTHRFGKHWGITFSAALRYTVAGSLGGRYVTNPAITNGVAASKIAEDDENNYTVYASSPVSGGFTFTPSVGLCWRW